MGIEEVLTALRTPWETRYVERLAGSIRRECLDHIIVWTQRSLRRILRDYFAYCEHSRMHLALPKGAPEPRALEKPEQGGTIVDANHPVFAFLILIAARFVDRIVFTATLSIR
jgi:putative transposase